MPIYDYVCKDCGHEEEIFFNKPIMEVVDPDCTKCGSKEFVRQMSWCLAEVPNGKMYLGKRDWKKNLTTNEKADVYLGNREPY